MKGGTFADAARALAGQAALLLGWRPDEFWRSTPAELATIYAAREQVSGASGLSRSELQAMMEHEGDG